MYTVKKVDYVHEFMDREYKLNCLCLFKNNICIGMISPEVTWLEEGEIDSSIIEASNDVRFEGHMHYSKSQILCYKVKCPMCQTFH